MAEVNSIVEGTVTSVMPFGAFVSIGNKESGLVHISELSRNYVKDINEFIKKGEKVRVKVIGVDERGKISLSIKQAEQPKEQSSHDKREQRKSGGGSSHRPDSYDWSARQAETMSFEDRLSRFKKESDEKMRANKSRLENKRSGGYSRRG